MKIRMYLDESGVERTAPHFVMAGYAASPEMWTVFDGLWAKTLKNFDVPDFHSLDFFWRKSKAASRKNYYKGWTDKKAWSFLGSLIGTIQGSELSPLGVTVDCDAFKARCFGERKMLTGGIVGRPSRTGYRWLTSGAPTKPYFAGFQWMLREGMSLAKRAEAHLRSNGTTESAQINFIFDWQEEMEGGAKTSFGELVKMVGPADPLVRRMGLVSYDHRNKHPGLQAADLLTFGWASFVNQGEEMYYERYYVMEQLSKANNRIRLINAQGLEDEMARLHAKNPALMDFIRATPETIKNKKPRAAK